MSTYSGPSGPAIHFFMLVPPVQRVVPGGDVARRKIKPDRVNILRGGYHAATPKSNRICGGIHIIPVPPKSRLPCGTRHIRQHDSCVKTLCGGVSYLDSSPCVTDAKSRICRCAARSNGASIQRDSAITPIIDSRVLIGAPSVR